MQPNAGSRGRGGGRSRSWFAAVAFAAVVLISTVAVSPAAAQENRTFIVEQGSTCTQIQPLGNGSMSAEAFYDYRVLDPIANYSSFGTTDIQADQTSQLFVYQGSDGLSLVFLHDKINELGGFVATADVSGLPSEGQWTVEDDNYTNRDDVFEYSDSGAHIEWVSNGERTDGAVFTGLGSPNYQTISVNLKFNEESNQYPFEEWSGSPSDNQIEQWVVRSGTGEMTQLDMSQPVEISPGTCSGGVSTFTATQTGTESATGTADGGTAASTAAMTTTAAATATPTPTQTATQTAADGATEPASTEGATGTTGGGDGGSGAFGPGFGGLLALAAIALLAAAALARRNE